MGETSQPDGRSRAAREGGARVAVACLAVGSATAAACLGLNMVLLPLILGHPDQWIAPGDIWQSIQAARFVANGALLFIYGAPETMSHGGYQYPPVWPLLMAPAVGLGDALELVDNRVFRVPRPTMMIPMVIVAGTVTAAALAAAVWRFAQRFNLSGRWGTVAAVALATFMPMGVFFHGEDLLVVAFTLVAAAAYGTGAGWVAAGLLTKQTMIAFVPAPARRVRSEGPPAVRGHRSRNSRGRDAPILRRHPDGSAESLQGAAVAGGTRELRRCGHP